MHNKQSVSAKIFNNSCPDNTHVLGWLLCRICNKCVNTNIPCCYSMCGHVSVKASARTALLQHLAACSKPHTRELRRGHKLATENPGRIPYAMSRSPSDKDCGTARRETCTVLGDVTMGYRTDHRPLTCIARSSEYNINHQNANFLN